MKFARPCRVTRSVLAASVLQVEDRIAHLRLRVVLGRRVDEGVTPAPVTFEWYQTSRTWPWGTSWIE